MNITIIISRATPYDTLSAADSRTEQYKCPSYREARLWAQMNYQVIILGTESSLGASRRYSDISKELLK